MIDPRIDDRVATSGAYTLKIVTPHTTEIITDVPRSNTWALRNQGHLIRMGRDGTTSGSCDVSVRSPGVTPQFWLEVSASPQPESIVGDWTLSINRNPHPQAPAGILKSSKLPLMEIWPMTGILHPFLARYWVDNWPTVSSPASIYAVRCTSRVMPLEPRHQISWIWGTRLSTHRMNSTPLVPPLPDS